MWTLCHPEACSGIGSCEGQEADPRDQATRRSARRDKSAHGMAGEGTEMRLAIKTTLGIAFLTKTLRAAYDLLDVYPISTS